MTCSTLESLAEKVCDLERRFLGEETVRALVCVERIVDKLATRGVKQLPLSRQVALLNQVLFREQSLRFGAAETSRVFTLTGTLLDGCGNCLGLTTAYMAVAGKLGIGVRPVLYEGHIAVCAEFNGQFQPIEVSRRGAALQGRLASLMYSGKGEPQILTDWQFLAVHKTNQAAFVYAPRHDYSTAQRLLESAIADFPGYVGAWINHAALQICMGEIDRAVESLEHALKLSPTGAYFRHAVAMMEHIFKGRVTTGRHVP